MDPISDSHLQFCLDNYCTHRMKYVRKYKLTICQLQLLLTDDDEDEIDDYEEVLRIQPHLKPHEELIMRLI